MGVKYSIITPCHNSKDIGQTIASVGNQEYENWEHILIDDASTDRTYERINSMAYVVGQHKYKILRNKENQQRAFSRNRGMKEAEGEWIVWLDADDYFLPYYLTVLEQATEKFPDISVFNYGGIVVWNSWSSTIRMSKQRKIGEVFKSGDIMSGGFAFKRECLEVTGYLPEHRSPYAFADMVKKEYPEIVPLYGERSLGNPWGDDWVMFYKLTRFFQPKLLEIAPFVVMIRGEKKLRE